MLPAAPRFMLMAAAVKRSGEPIVCAETASATSAAAAVAGTSRRNSRGMCRDLLLFDVQGSRPRKATAERLLLLARCRGKGRLVTLTGAHVDDLRRLADFQ